MAGAIKIETGSRLQMAYDPELGQEANFNMVSTFNKALDESAFLVSIPMTGGAAVEADENRKLLFRYNMGDESMVLAGFVDDVVKVGVRRYWKIRRVSEQRQFFQRSDERVKVVLKVEYMQPTWPLNSAGEIDKEDGMTMDISAGGVALFLNRRFNVGEMIELTLPRVGVSKTGRKIENLVAQVCWVREAPKGNIYRNICGIKFHYADNTEKERVLEYMQAVKTVFKL